MRRFYTPMLVGVLGLMGIVSAWAQEVAPTSLPEVATQTASSVSTAFYGIVMAVVGMAVIFLGFRFVMGWVQRLMRRA